MHPKCFPRKDDQHGRVWDRKAKVVGRGQSGGGCLKTRKVKKPVAVKQSHGTAAWKSRNPWSQNLETNLSGRFEKWRPSWGWSEKVGVRGGNRRAWSWSCSNLNLANSWDRRNPHQGSRQAEEILKLVTLEAEDWKEKLNQKTGESSLRTTKSVRLKVESLKIGYFHLPAARLNKQESNLLALKRHLLKRSKTCALSFAQFAVRDEQIVRNADFISAGKTILIKLVHRKLSLQRK